MSRDQGPSRSARKRADRALQELGERLVEMDEAELAAIPLPDDVAAAVQSARNIKERGGRRRQLQYIGRLMRRIDVAAIAQAVAAIDARRERAAEEFHEVEAWRDRLLLEGVAALPALRAERPHADTTVLTRLLQECGAPDPTRSRHARRELFRYLRDELFRT